MKYLRKKDGFVFNYIFGKIFRGNGKINIFVIKCCSNEIICLVRGLERYFVEVKWLGIDMFLGYFFRMVIELGRVINELMFYFFIYERFKCYLIIFGIDEGEILYSLRVGCVVYMCFLNVVYDVYDFMNYVGWVIESFVKYYSRYDILLDVLNIVVRLV